MLRKIGVLALTLAAAAAVLPSSIYAQEYYGAYNNYPQAVAPYQSYGPAYAPAPYYGDYRDPGFPQS